MRSPFESSRRAGSIRVLENRRTLQNGEKMRKTWKSWNHRWDSELHHVQVYTFKFWAITDLRPPFESSHRAESIAVLEKLIALQNDEKSWNLQKSSIFSGNVEEVARRFSLRLEKLETYPFARKMKHVKLQARQETICKTNWGILRNLKNGPKNYSNVGGLFSINFAHQDFYLQTSGKPSTWSPLVGLEEKTFLISSEWWEK